MYPVLRCRAIGATLVCLASWSATSWSPLEAARVGGGVASQVATTELFSFQSDPEINLHHFLYRWAQAGPGADASRLDPRITLRDVDRDALASLPPVDRDAWARAVQHYRRSLIQRDLLFDEGMVAVRDCLADTGDCGAVAAADLATLEILSATLPAFERGWWTRHHAANRAWIDRLGNDVSRFERAIAARVSEAYGGDWPQAPIRVDLTAYANRVGGYTTGRPHITISSLDEGSAGYLGLELLFHEASHGDSLELPLRRLVRRSFDALGEETPRDLWHMTIFFTAGEATRAVLAEAGIDDYVPYAEHTGIWERRPPNRRAFEALDAPWRAALGARSGFGDAMEAVARRYAGRSPIAPRPTVPSAEVDEPRRNRR